MLLNEFDADDLPEILADGDYCAQEKMDGRRVVLVVSGGVVTAYNRNGQPTDAPECVLNDAVTIGKDVALDGELVGGVFHAFDVLVVNGNDVRSLELRERLSLLATVAESSSIRIIETTYTTEDKTALFNSVRNSGGEGVVFKCIYAPYTAGRSMYWLKHKFYKTASVVVGGHNIQHSVRCQLWRNGKFVDAGNVSIPQNMELPKHGTVLEVKYLYAFKESGYMFQPVFLMVRDDVSAEDCMVEQLKYGNN